MMTDEELRSFAGDDGWISWSGGPNPVPGRRVEVRFSDGLEEAGMESNFWAGGGHDWWRHQCEKPSQRIIAFRLVSEAADKGSSLRDTHRATDVAVVAVPRDQLETLRRSLQLGNLLPGEGENLISLWILASDAEARS